MEILESKKQLTKKAINSIKRIQNSIAKQTDHDVLEGLRDGLIQRFEFSFDIFWKFLKVYLREKNNIEADAASPNKIFRKCLEQKLITQDEFNVLVNSTEDRNLTTHTYEEELAIEVSEKIEKYYLIMKQIVDRL